MEVSASALKDFLVQKSIYGSLPRDGRGVLIPDKIAKRILGLNSDPPEDIDELEYSHSIGFLAKKMGISNTTLRKRIYESDLAEFMDWDGRGMRIPRSICKIIYPEFELIPKERDKK